MFIKVNASSNYGTAGQALFRSKANAMQAEACTTNGRHRQRLSQQAKVQSRLRSVR
jgi:hypothetical protein